MTVMPRQLTFTCKRCPKTWTVPLERPTDRPTGMPDETYETICDECIDKMGRTPGPIVPPNIGMTNRVARAMKKRNPVKGPTP